MNEPEKVWREEPGSIITDMLHGGWSMAAIRAMFPGLFPEEPAPQAHQWDALDWFNLWHHAEGFTEDFQLAGPNYPLREVLEKKASRYGQLGMPYVIAVNSSDMMHGNRDFQDTLFGSPPEFAAPGSAPDIGFWGTAATPKHTRVSAVLFTTNLCAPTVLMGQVYACLYLNPYSAQPYDGVLAKLPTFRLENGEVRECVFVVRGQGLSVFVLPLSPFAPRGVNKGFERSRSKAAKLPSVERVEALHFAPKRRTAAAEAVEYRASKSRTSCRVERAHEAFIVQRSGSEMRR